MNRKYLITRLIWGPLLFKTRSFGAVELRSAKSDTPLEKACLEESARVFGLRLRAHEDNVSREASVEYCSRITVIVEASGISEARRIAQSHFEETVDIIEATGGILRYTLYEAGLVRDLDIGTMSPILPIDRSTTNQRMTTIDAHVDNLHYMGIEQLLLSHDAQGRNKIELADRILRSSHWSRKARMELNPQLRMLFRWFAIESIWITKSEDEGANLDDVISPTLWALGFPNGNRMKMVQSKITEFHSEITDYNSWRVYLRNKLNEMRVFRNQSVHSGFRPFDVRLEDLKLYDNISHKACGHVQHFAICGLNEGLDDSRILIEYMPLIFEKYAFPYNVKNLLQNLTEPDRFVRHVQPDWEYPP